MEDNEAEAWAEELLALVQRENQRMDDTLTSMQNRQAESAIQTTTFSSIVRNLQI